MRHHTHGQPRPLGRPFAPGVSGNPSGRPKGLTIAVQRKAGKDGKKLVDGLWLIAYGTPTQRTAHFGEPVNVSAKERLTAISELLDRGWGRAAQSMQLSGDPEHPIVPAIHNHFAPAHDTPSAK